MRRAKFGREVQLRGAFLKGNLDGSNARFRAGRNRDVSIDRVLVADGINVDGAVLLRDIIAFGEVRLLGASITKNLDFSGSKIRTASKALSIDGAEIGSDIYLKNIEAKGEVRLLGTRLGGSLVCDGGVLEATSNAEAIRGNALLADRIEAREGVSLQDLNALGEVRLICGNVSGDFNCDRGKFRWEGDRARAPGMALIIDIIYPRQHVTEGCQIVRTVRTARGKGKWRSWLRGHDTISYVLMLIKMTLRFWLTVLI